ncbi:MAG: hypothetical protein ACOH12_14585 [Parvibaculaceae bacterium]
MEQANAITSSRGWDIVFDPSLPVSLIIALGTIGALVVAYAAWRGARSAGWRLGTLIITLLAILNPTIRQENRDPVDDVAVVLVDQSQSMSINTREGTTRAADAAATLKATEDKLKNITGIKTRIVTVGDTAASGTDDNAGTNAFAALEQTLSDIPSERLAGVILITDGEIHDVPQKLSALGFNAPVHGLIIGDKNERDRRLTVLEAPRFGIVNKPVTLTLRVDDASGASIVTGIASVTVRIDGKQVQQTNVQLGEPTKLTLTLDHAGPNVVEIDVAPGPDELTLVNNRAVIIANGIHDRLRVLLISGEPNPGERTWRNFLRADPSVDLVHFTILRPPEIDDGVPIEELSLISFPTNELFVEKLSSFDLVIFDRYLRQSILPIQYLANVADFVENGGAVLDAAGPSFASAFSLYRTPLARILPAEPSGTVSTGAYRAHVTDLGKRHPVTAGLPGDASPQPTWGSWFRVIDTSVNHGSVLMDAPNGRPLLVLDRAGKGRVAQLLSDQFWLWSRGYEGGGPQSELLRRVAHWLMKEPDLEEENLAATINGQTLTIKRRSMSDDMPEMEVTSPSGKITKIKPETVAPGRFDAQVPATELGLYRVTQGALTAVAAAGPLNPREFADVRATDALLKPITDGSGGGTFWVGHNGENTPDIRATRPGKDAAGSNWLGLQRNNQYFVRAVKQSPLLVGPLALLLILGTLALAWRREGR